MFLFPSVFSAFLSVCFLFCLLGVGYKGACPLIAVLILRRRLFWAFQVV